jgi:hypothetical protein
MYISKINQDEMIKLISVFLKESECGEKSTRKSEMIMNKLFTNYIDKIINGVIYSPRWKFYTFGNPEDLFQYARMHIYKSIIKQQWQPEKGNIFNFFTTVIYKNLLSETLASNKKLAKYSDIELETIVNNDNMIINENNNQAFVITYIFDEMKDFFKGKEKFLQLCDVLIEYYTINIGKKFVKKEFIEYAKTFMFSPSFVNNFFNHLKKIKKAKNSLNELLRGG